MSHDERYVIRKKIADGGMAEVFLATQEGADGFSRLVVLKRVHRAFSGLPQFGHMLVDEAHIAMTLNHGNIVPVLDLAQRDGWYFLVMELVDGWDLRSVLVRAEQAGFPLPRGLALHVTAEVCRGLAYAHAATSAAGKPLGIVHRDISPQNVLLSEHGEVRVTDFGVAKAMGKRTRTEAGVIKGNIDFMSPEQAAGGTVDASSDVFSTGALLYHALTGQLPFRGANELETLQRVQAGELTPPEEVRPDLPAPVAAIVKKAMQLHPADRYRGAKEMMDEIEEYLRSNFPAPGQSELAAWLAELSRRDGEQPASKRPGMPTDQATIILGPADILSAEEAAEASATPPLLPRSLVPALAPPLAEHAGPPPLPPGLPTAAPGPTPGPVLAPPLPPARKRARLLVIGGALVAAGVVALIVTTARNQAPTDDVSKDLTGTAPPPEPPTPPTSPAPPARPAAPPPPASTAGAQEPVRRPTVAKRPARATRQKSKARQKSGATRKKQSKARSGAR